MLCTHATAWLDSRFQKDVCIRTLGSKITEVSSALFPLPGEEVCDLQGDYLLPGFVDVHTHAYGGHDTMEGEAAIRFLSRAYRKQGVAAFLPTTMSADQAETAAAIAGIASVMASPESEGAVVAGAHMEAPFLSPSKCGAQRAECFLLPSLSAFESLCAGNANAVRLITLAPELEGADTFIQAMNQRSIVCSAGHTAATAEQLHHAADLGLTHCTHTFNAQPALHHRNPGVTGAALTDHRVYCEMICDGFHLHPDTVKLILAAKGPDKALVITDSMEAAGMPDGSYALGGQKVLVKDGKACLENGTIAGSTLTMKQAFCNLLHWGIAAETAVALCTATPAASVGLKDFGRLAPGCSSIITRWSRDWQMKQVF